MVDDFVRVADIFSDKDVVSGVEALIIRERLDRLKCVVIKCPQCGKTMGPYFEDHAVTYMLHHEYDKHSLEAVGKEDGLNPQTLLDEMTNLKAARIMRLKRPRD